MLTAPAGDARSAGVAAESRLEADDSPCSAGASFTDLGFLILTRAETVGLVLARNAGDGSAQVDLDYVVPRYQGFTLREFVYRPGGPPAARGYR